MKVIVAAAPALASTASAASAKSACQLNARDAASAGQGRAQRWMDPLNTPCGPPAVAAV
jgi:hypothetical protein